ncbi:hypothetical protein PFMALIP_02888 [Plasmodium falciparum MaliPS096_E11]|uniref:Uncharacterized protein n=1 Tax=Plasmodium falciparum MaliPS096_E11 TaxID=1036727 RepID=A0A024WQS7_PLAFA|nr:hypothetical protein PFMALIP_02888 [Plasmodium falciparum MaliPS096_E11]
MDNINKSIIKNIGSMESKSTAVTYKECELSLKEEKEEYIEYLKKKKKILKELDKCNSHFFFTYFHKGELIEYLHNQINMHISDSNNLNKYKGSSFALIIHEISDLLSLITTVDKSKNKNKIKLVNIGHKLNTLMRSHYERIYDCDNSLVSIINKIKKLYKCYRSMEEKYLKKTKKQNINININTNTNTNTNTNKIEKENVAGNNDEEDPNDGINILHDDLLKEEINNIDNNIKNDINKYTIKCNNNNEKLIQDPFFQNEFVQGIDNYINQKDENNCHDNIKDKIDTLNCFKSDG